MNNSLNNTLVRLGRELNRANVFWAVGGSVMLQQYGLIQSPQDIDILVSEEDAPKVCEILSSIGEKVAEREADSIYATKFFCEYRINGIEVDVMAGLKIKKNEQIFEYDFNKSTKRIHFYVEDEQIPFSTLNDWLILYSWMPNKEGKVKMIEAYMTK